MTRMKRYQKTILQVVVVVIIIISVRFYQQIDVKKGEAADFVATDLSGNVIKTQNIKEPYLLHFWAPWCAICKLEQGNISYANKHTKIITVASFSTSKQEVADYIKKHNLSWNVIYDKNNEIAKKYGIRGVPASFFINSEKQIKFIEIGYTTTIGFLLRMFFIDIF
jgi:thiol-disulfide isomerase/thioredoxin